MESSRENGMGAVAILNKLVRVDFIEKVTSEQKLESLE